MLKNHRLAQAIADVGMYEFRRQLQYKGGGQGCEVWSAARFDPSSKRCSRCASIKPTMALSEREHRCDHCGRVNQRDLHAALNREQRRYPSCMQAELPQVLRDVAPAEGVSERVSGNAP